MRVCSPVVSIVRLLVCLSVALCVFSFVCQTTCLIDHVRVWLPACSSVRSFVCFVCLFVYMSICLSNHACDVHVCVCLNVRMFECSFVCVFVGLFVSLLVC